MSGDDHDSDANALTAAIIEDVSAERLEHLQGPDTSDGALLGQTVGINLRAMRRERGLSIEALANTSGLEASILTALESGSLVPSMRAIWHLATALEVPFGELLEDESAEREAPADFRIQRADSGRVIASSSNDFRSRVLFLEGDKRSPEVYELTLTPGCHEQADAHADETFEHITVIRGRLRVVVGDEEATLSPGDSMFFRADQPHSYENPGEVEAMALLVVRFG